MTILFAIRGIVRFSKIGGSADATGTLKMTNAVLL